MTPWHRVLLGHFQLVKKFPAFMNSKV